MKSKKPLPKGAAKSSSTKKSKPAVAKAKKAPPKSKPTGKHPGGRPTKYDASICDKVRTYFNRAPYETTVRTITRKDGSTVQEEVRIAAELPTLAGLACLLGVHRDTLNEWAREYPEFSDAVKAGKAHQERILVTNGLTGLYEGAFGIFTAKNILGWRDKLAIGGDEDNPAPIPVAHNADAYSGLRDKLTVFTGATAG